MKKLLLLFGLISTLEVLGQNMIQNGDFEECNGSTDCPELKQPLTIFQSPTYEGQFDREKNWNDFGSYQSNSTPDIWQSPKPTYLGYNGDDPYLVPQSGSHMAGIYDEEGIYYDFTGLNTAPYHVSFWICASQANTTSNLGISVFLTTIAPSNSSCSNMLGGNVTLIHREEFTTNTTSWKKIEFNFTNLDGNTPNRYLVITGLRDGQCSRYIYIDNVSMENECCPDYIKYQNYNDGAAYAVHLPSLTQRSNYISAGYDVGCPYTSKGNVIIQNGDKIKFRAGGSIQLYSGFVVNSGGVFDAKIENCAVESPLIPSDYDIKLLYKNNIAFFDCSGNWQSAFAFSSENATYYRVRIFDRIGEKVYDKMDYIHEKYTVYWDGSGISPNISLASESPWVVELELFNCVTGAYKLFSYTIIYHYIDGCTPHYKTEEISKVQSSIQENATQTVFDVFPIPADKSLSIGFLKSSESVSTVLMVDGFGKEVYKKNVDEFEKQTHVITFDVSELSSGIYSVQLKTDKSIYSQKAIITH